jgi:hypothetical protein
MADKRVYTFVSGKAVKGLQRLVRNRDVYVSATPSDRGYTVLTTPRDNMTAKGISLERLKA